VKYAFVYADTETVPVQAEYNADAEEFTVTIREESGGPRIGPNGPDGTKRGLMITRHVDDFSTYAIGNAFGAVVTVTKIRLTFLGLAFENRGAPASRQTSFHVDRASAQAMKPNISLLFVCDTPAGGLQLLRGVRTFPLPSLTNDMDALHVFQWLLVDLTSVWVFDRRTGVVLKKIDDS
jgi:hypothetical protein